VVARVNGGYHFEGERLIDCSLFDKMPCLSYAYKMAVMFEKLISWTSWKM
jgi:hypothetical protein